MAQKKTHWPLTEDNAVLMLDAAEKLGVDKGVVRVEQAGLTAPEEVLDKAFGRKSSTKSQNKNEED